MQMQIQNLINMHTSYINNTVGRKSINYPNIPLPQGSSAFLPLSTGSGCVVLVVSELEFGPIGKEKIY